MDSINDKRSQSAGNGLPSGAASLLLCIVWAFFIYKIFGLWFGPVITEVRLRNHGKETTGNVCDAFSKKNYVSGGRFGIGHYETTHYVIVCYQGLSKKFVNKKDAYNTGQDVPVTYLPSDPKVAILGHPRKSILAIAGFFSFSGIVVFVCFLFISSLLIVMFLLFFGVFLYRLGVPVDSFVKIKGKTIRFYVPGLGKRKEAV